MANLTSQERDLRGKLVISRGTNTNNRSSLEDERFLEKLENNTIEQEDYIDVENQKSSETFISQLLLARYDSTIEFSSKLLEKIFVEQLRAYRKN